MMCYIVFSHVERRNRGKGAAAHVSTQGSRRPLRAGSRSDAVGLLRYARRKGTDFRQAENIVLETKGEIGSRVLALNEAADSITGYAETLRRAGHHAAADALMGAVPHFRAAADRLGGAFKEIEDNARAGCGGRSAGEKGGAAC
jgi:hypothetical protein